MRLLHPKDRTRDPIHLNATAILSRDSIWGGRDDYPDARDLDCDRREQRAKIEAWARKHGYGGYCVFAAEANGGYCVDDVTFDEPYEYQDGTT